MSITRRLPKSDITRQTAINNANGAITNPPGGVNPLTAAGQPELREYYLRGVLNDAEIGVPSDVIRVVVGTI